MKYRFFNSIFVIVIFVIFGSCKNDNSTKPTVSDPIMDIKAKVALLEETSGKIEKALIAGDTQAFLGFIGSEKLKYYNDAVQKNSAKLAQFADVFKTRRLVSCDGFYAIYEVQFNGVKFELSMVLDEDGKWKLKDI